MASPNTLALRDAQAHLRPQRWYLNRPMTPRSAVGGEFAAMLAEHARIKNVQRRTANAALVRYNDTKRGLIRTVPVSGSGRRRAKAHRNRGLCMEPVAGRLCPRGAVQYERCANHLTEEILAAHAHVAVPVSAEGLRIERGRQYERDALTTPDWVLDRLRQDVAEDSGRADRFKQLVDGEWRDLNEDTR